MILLAVGSSLEILSSLLRCWVLCERLCCSAETIANGAWDLWSWIDDSRSRTWLGARFVDLTAILCGVTDKRQRLGPALDLRCNGAHALSGGGTNATAVIPSRAVVWRASLLVGLR